MEACGSLPPGSLPERLVMRSLAERYVSSLLDKCIGAADEVLQEDDLCTGSRRWEDDSFVGEDLDEDGLSELLATVARSANAVPKAKRRPPPREAPMRPTLPLAGRLPAHFRRTPQPWSDSRDSESSRLQRLLAYSRNPASQPAPSCHHVGRGLRANRDPSQPCCKPIRPCSAPSRPSSRHAPSVATCIASQRHSATVVSNSSQGTQETGKGVSPLQRSPLQPRATADQPVPRRPKVPRSCWQVQRDRKKQPNESRSVQADGRRMLRRRDAVRWRNQDMMAKFRGPAAEQAHVSRAAAASLNSFGAVTKVNAGADADTDHSLEEAMREPPTITSAAQEGGDTLRQDPLLPLKQSFGTLFQQTRKSAEPEQIDREGTLAMYTLHQLATATNLSLDYVMAGRRAFQAQDVEKRGALDLSGFEKAVLNLQKEVHGTCTDDGAKVQHLCGATWEEGETGMDLLKFLTWFANYGFSDDMLLSKEAKGICRLSRQFQISRFEVEKIKRHFDTFEADEKGNIDMQEFTKLMKKLLKVPNDLELPPTRIRHYWSQIDTDNSGTVGFQDFLAWWINYFEKSISSGRAALAKPFDDFYKTIRTLKHPDPPAYRSAKKR